MNNHLQHHEYEHQERLKRAQQARLVASTTQAERKPNTLQIAVGKALVELGEQLQSGANAMSQTQEFEPIR